MKILIIARNFPPSASARATQMGKICQLLLNANFELRIIAGVDNKNSIKEKINNVKKLFPVEFIESFFSAGSFCARAASRVPDSLAALSFVNKAARLAIKSVAEWRPDLILSVSTPFSSHLAAAAVRRKFPNIPWVVFFSDPYPGDFLPRPYFNRSVDISILKKQVANVLKEADAVFLTSRYASLCFEKNIKVDLSQKTFVVPHLGGSGALTLSNEKTALKNAIGDRFFSKYLVYTGSIGPERTFPELLEAVRNVAQKLPNVFQGLLVFDKNQNKTFKNAVARQNVGKWVRFLDSVSPNVAFEIACAATCNLTLEAKMPFSPFCPSKFADYVVANRPILAITPKNSEIRDLTNFYRCCETVSADTNEITDALERIFVEKLNKARPNQYLQDYFSERNVIALYTNCFEKAIALRKGKSLLK